MRKAKTLFVVVLFMCLTSLSLFAQYDNSPATFKVIPSVIWAPASGGGTWYTELQIWSRTAGTEVDIYFMYGAGVWRYHATLWTSVGADDCYKSTNILSTLYGLDSGFTYYGRSGTLLIYSYGGSVQATARTRHTGNYAKTINGLSNTDSNTAALGRYLMMMNVMQSSSYRTSLTLYNHGSACDVHIQVIHNGGVTGSTITRSLAQYEYQAFDVFAEAGLTGSTYTNCFVSVWAQDTGGPQGRVFCSGAAVHNSTNDPAYHVAQNGWIPPL